MKRDAGMETGPEARNKMLIEAFVCPPGYDIPGWSDDLKQCLYFGCDWLELFQDMHNPAAAIAVENMAERIARLERAGGGG